MAELESESLDMIILGQINAHHFFEDIQGIEERPLNLKERRATS